MASIRKVYVIFFCVLGILLLIYMSLLHNTESLKKKIKPTREIGVEFTLSEEYIRIKKKLLKDRDDNSDGDDNFVDNSLTTERYITYRRPDPKLLEGLDKEFQSIERDTEPNQVSPKCRHQVFLLIVVVSAPDGYIRRNAIRSTWASIYQKHKDILRHTNPFPQNRHYHSEDVVKTVFLIGKSKAREHRDLVLTEAILYGDIVLGELSEDYRNLTMKTRLGLKWAYYHCQARYIVKTDDDVFMNPVQLVEWLKDQPQKNFYTGWCNFGSPVVRDENNKWYISYEDYKEETYPGYCLGGGYLMSDDVLGRILKISYGRKLFPMEDLYVGLMVRDLRDVQPTDHKDHFDLIFEGRKNLCEFNKLFLAHAVKPEDMLKMTLQASFARKICIK